MIILILKKVIIKKNQDKNKLNLDINKFKIVIR